MGLFKLLLLAVLLHSSVALNFEIGDDECCKYEDCIGCTRLCVWYSNLDGGFCGSQTMDKRLYLFKVRSPSACFRVRSTDKWDGGKFTSINATAFKGKFVGQEKTPTALPLPLSSLDAPTRRNASTQQSTSSSSPTAADTRAEKENGKYTDVRTGKRQTSKLLQANCRQYAIIAMQMTAKERNEEKLYRKCLRRLQL